MTQVYTDVDSSDCKGYNLVIVEFNNVLKKLFLFSLSVYFSMLFQCFPFLPFWENSSQQKLHLSKNSKKLTIQLNTCKLIVTSHNFVFKKYSYKGLPATTLY